MKAIKGLVLLVAMSGCTHVAVRKEPDLTRRAAWDMSCSQGELKLVLLSDWTRGVVGCGKKRVYVFDEPRDSWMMSSETVPDTSPK